MGYERIIRKGLKLASKQFETMKLNVSYTPWVGSSKGVDAFGTTRTYRCLADLERKLTRTASGQIATVVATLFLLEPATDVTPNAGQTRQQPLDARDKWVLPDGTTSPVVKLGGFADSGTNEPFFHEIVLGKV